MTTHKPTCIADCLDRTGEGCLYVDADVSLFVEPLRRPTSGTPTRRHPPPPEGARPLHLENGTNAGVLYSSQTPAARALLDASDHRLRRRRAAAGQKALSTSSPALDPLSLGPRPATASPSRKLEPRSFNDLRLKNGAHPPLQARRPPTPTSPPSSTATAGSKSATRRRSPPRLRARHALHVYVGPLSPSSHALTGPNFVGWSRLVCRMTGGGVAGEPVLRPGMAPGVEPRRQHREADVARPGELAQRDLVDPEPGLGIGRPPVGRGSRAPPATAVEQHPAVQLRE